MKVRVFLSRYNFPLCIILFLVGAALSEFSQNLWPWVFCALLGFIIVMRAGPRTEYKWACKKCGHQADRVEKYCTKCGGLMELKKIIQYKICENDHYMFDEYDSYKFCPKCGKPLREQVISETGKELSSKVS